ncbi:glycosyltransferase involved in cell wall biosynthesis [Couchioplanes caeruleus]|uniref:Glycosyl transferase family 1 n=2 Tax=Couchioplanes caeruleus TaxID=56438 RepID=A0A1K0G169_9ACTN|nr:glycosyl transferase family 1 [Couchioplanes caeruleus subsp. caeruleus]ROP33661.1 glycosyltransferase involved in cell wall biosynthesis [Couchioplanes caeruleus]
MFLNWRDTRNPHGGGSEVYVEKIAEELIRRGYLATLFCAAHSEGPADETTAAGLRVLRRGGRHTVYLWAALTYLLGVLGFGPLSRRGGRPDVLVDVGNGLPFLSPLWCRRPVIALVHHVHREQWPVVLTPRLARIGWWIESRLAPRVYRKCRYVTVSAASRDELAVIGVDPERVTIVHNGTPEMAPAAPVARTPEPSLVVVGRLVPHKRVEMALDAVAALSPQFAGLSLVVAGQGWWEDELREYAEGLGIADQVRFAGFVSDEEKRVMMSEAWLALTPSLKEGWGLTIVEAGAVGTPNIAFRGAGGVEESLVDGQTGLLAEDHADFIAKVRLLLADDALRIEMGSAARAHADRFTWESAGEKFAALVEQPRVGGPGASRVGTTHSPGAVDARLQDVLGHLFLVHAARRRLGRAGEAVDQRRRTECAQTKGDDPGQEQRKGSAHHVTPPRSL